VPVVKGLPERPQTVAFTTINEYTAALEKYVDALENWIDIRAFQDGDDEKKKPQEPQPPKRKEGWFKPGCCRRFHYFVEGRSLCRNYGIPGEMDQDTGNKEAGVDDCITCFRELVKRRAKLGVEKIE
jgi:hypothetical protein